MNAHRKTILVADCHEEGLIVLEKLLEDAGFDTTTVWTAKDALRLVDSRAFDLILINEYLPDAGCEEILKALQIRKKPPPRIVMQAGAPETVDFTRLEALGAKDIVCKHSFRQIVELVREFLVSDSKQLAA
jgi:CheY-like chemotaxis protein